MADITKINVNGTDYDIKDANAITTESDPTVPSWAKQSTKPSYDAQEIYAQYAGGYGQAQYVQDALDDIGDNKQDTLVSGTNIKTVNNESILGSGNIDIQGGGSTYTAGTGIDITSDVISNTAPIWHGNETGTFTTPINADQLEGYTVNTLLKLIYPVGSIYMSTVNTSPSTFITGTTWTKLEDRFLLGAGSSYTAGATGGSSSQTVSFSNGRAQIGYNTANSNLHMLANGTRFTPGNSAKTGGNWGANTENTSLSTQLAGSQTLDNMPPYLVVYMWERTA